MRHTFFSFHYDDVWRCMQVRNCWVTEGKQATGFVDKADFEKVERQGSTAIERWIDSQMVGASVTAVLIGNQTVNRRYVRYEIDQTLRLNMGIFGIHINALKDETGSQEKYWGEEDYLLKFGKVEIYKPTSLAEIKSDIGE